jgi:hypothetical protein
MKVNWIFSLFVIALLFCLSSEVIEGFTNYKRRTNFRGAPGHFGRGVYKGSQFNIPTNHSWKRGPETGIYDGTPYHWGGWRRDIHPTVQNYFPSKLYRSTCKTGCGATGNGGIGCVNPSNLQDSCVFSTDCNGC